MTPLLYKDDGLVTSRFELPESVVEWKDGFDAIVKELRSSNLSGLYKSAPVNESITVISSNEMRHGYPLCR
jgi:hypothetical protein